MSGPNGLAEGNLRGVMGSAMIQSAFGGGSGQPFKRFVVEEVIFDPAELDEDRIRYFKEEYGLGDVPFLDKLPENTVIGKLALTPETGMSKPLVLFPFFSSHFQLPVKPGEHVWAYFESDNKIDYGYWVTRINEPRTVEDLNYTHADRKFQPAGANQNSRDKFSGTDNTPGFDNGANIGDASPRSTASLLGERDAYEKILKNSDGSKVTDKESVPRRRKRPGDMLLQGSNNSSVYIGTDRTGRTALFEKGKNGKAVKDRPDLDSKLESGTVDISVGLGQKTTAAKKKKNKLNFEETDKTIKGENTKEGDPDFENDVGRLYLSMKTKADENFNVNITGIPQEKGDIAAAVLKTDHVRIIARKSIKFIMQPKMDSKEEECGAIVLKENGDIVFIPSKEGYVKLGSEDADSAILCSPLAAPSGGTVTAPPIVSTMGAQVGIGGANGRFSTKVLIK